MRKLIVFMSIGSALIIALLIIINQCIHLPVIVLFLLYVILSGILIAYGLKNTELNEKKA
jgi:hypothetical protein